MLDIYILNADFEIVGVIDDYVSCIWRPSYSDVGDFELYLGANKSLLDLLQINRYIVRSIDVSVNNGVNTYHNVMIIKNISISTEIDDGDHLTVTGRELKYLLHQRIIWSQTNLTGKAENGIRRLVTENAINPTDTKRKIPNLILGAVSGLTDSIDKQITGDPLDEAITNICNTYGYGWEMYLENNHIVLIVYSGVNRSYNQTQRPYVIFSDDFENLYNTDYQLQTELYSNCTLIGGEGEGIDRIYTTIGTEFTGLNRYETFTDARDLSQNKDTNDEIPYNIYIELLKERGRESLAELSYTEGFSGEVLDTAFKLGVDFDLGDIVTVINSYGITKDVRVLSVIDSYDESGHSIIPQFNI